MNFAVCCAPSSRRSKKAGNLTCPRDAEGGVLSAPTPGKVLAQSLRRDMRRKDLGRIDSPSLLCCVAHDVDSSGDLHSLAGVSPAPSPSKLARRKRIEPVPDPVGVTPCDNFECVVLEGVFNSETWHTARLGSRIFRFCSQECWLSWLNNPGHMGSWSSPLLSYQTSPGTPTTKLCSVAPPPLSLNTNMPPYGSPSYGKHVANCKSLTLPRAESKSATSPLTMSLLAPGMCPSTDGLPSPVIMI